MRLRLLAAITALLLSLAPAQAVGDWSAGATPASMVTRPVLAPSSNEGHSLEITCDPSGPLGIHITLHGHSLITNNLTGVTFRLDSDPPITQTWAVYESRNVSPRTAEDAQSFISALLSVEKVVIQYIAYTSTPTFIFPVAGLREALQSLGCYQGPA